MISTVAHDADCMCVPCMMADMDAHVAANGGTVYLAQQTAPEKTLNRTAGQRVGRGYVRTISPKQVRFIKSLIASKDLRKLSLLPGQFIDDARIPTMGVKGGTALIEKLLACPDKLTNSVRMATSGQISYIRSLNDQAGTILSESDIKAITFADASKTIDMLKAAKNNAPKASTTNAVTEGMYKVGERIFKVQAAKSTGNLYAKELIEGSFEYVAGAISIVRSKGIRMTLDEAKEYGKRTGQCCQCGRTLTVKESIEAGIGPICAGKF